MLEAAVPSQSHRPQPPLHFFSQSLLSGQEVDIDLNLLNLHISTILAK